jgi:hypothetical protein
MVWEGLLPGATVPQLIDVRLWVQEGSEYTPTFTAVTMVPLEGSIWYVLIAPRVVTVRSIPATAMAIIAPIDSCLSAMVCSST